MNIISKKKKNFVETLPAQTRLVWTSCAVSQSFRLCFLQFVLFFGFFLHCRHVRQAFRAGPSALERACFNLFGLCIWASTISWGLWQKFFRIPFLKSTIWMFWFVVVLYNVKALTIDVFKRKSIPSFYIIWPFSSIDWSMLWVCQINCFTLIII